MFATSHINHGFVDETIELAREVESKGHQLARKICRAVELNRLDTMVVDEAVLEFNESEIRSSAL